MTDETVPRHDPPLRPRSSGDDGVSLAIAHGPRRVGNTRKTWRASVSERFWSYVEKTDGCWLWTGGKDGYGYGEFFVARIHGKKHTIKAHRWSFEDANGPLDEGMLACHECDTPACVRPEHLFAGTHSDNSRDCINKGRYWSHQHPDRQPTGEAHGRSKIDAVSIPIIRARANAGDTMRKIAGDYGVAANTIHLIVRYKTWRHIT